MPNSLKVALVTGAGKRRVGWHVAEALAGRGYALAIHYRSSAAEAAETLASFAARGGQALGGEADLGGGPAAPGHGAADAGALRPARRAGEHRRDVEEQAAGGRDRRRRAPLPRDEHAGDVPVLSAGGAGDGASGGGRLHRDVRRLGDRTAV